MSCCQQMDEREDGGRRTEPRGGKTLDSEGDLTESDETEGEEGEEEGEEEEGVY